MQFEDATGRRAEVALELLMEGLYINNRGLGLKLAGSALECRQFVDSHPEAVDAAAAEREFASGRATLDELLADAKFASALAGLPQQWELLYDYGGETIRLCRLDHAGTLLWDAGWPKSAV